MRNKGLICIFILGLLLCATSSYAATMTFQDDIINDVTKDTYIDEQAQTSDRGIADPLYLREVTDKSERILLYFDISALPAYSSIASFNFATLSLYKSQGDQKLITVGVYKITKDVWDEGNEDAQHDDDEEDHADWNYLVHHGLTWNTPGLGTTDYDLSSEVTTDVTLTGKYYNWDVSDIVKSWWSGAQNYGFFIRQIAGVQGQHKFDSSEGTNKPYLTVDYTPIPEPASAALLTIGLLGLMGIGIKKNKKEEV